MPLRQLVPDPSGAAEQNFQHRVDIIAVHGLNPRSKPDEDHAWDTWRKPEGSSGRLWLRDDLPARMPEARIFLYVYNSKLIYGGEKELFIEKADDLLNDIRNQRKKISNRPIIFIGHSLGGLLIKQALVNAYLNAKYRSIYDSTTGLVFFGTPHRGGNNTLVGLGSAAARIARLLGAQSSKDIEKTLQNGSLFSQILRFQWKEQLLNYKIVSFWEGIGDIVSKDSATFDLPGENQHIVKIDASHSDMCRFDGLSQKDQDNYEMVWNSIEDVYDAALERDKSHEAWEKMRWEVLNWVYNEPTDTRHVAVQDGRRGEGNWFINEPNYQVWKEESGQSRFLWCYGIPGSGKTFLFSFAVDDLRRYTHENGYGFCYAYLQYQEAERQNPTQILRCLLKQLTEQDSDVWNNCKVCRDRLANEHRVLSLKQMETLLTYAFSRFSKIFVALDALDETNEINTLRPLLEAISRFQKLGVHFLLTSRHDSSSVRSTMTEQNAIRIQIRPSSEDMRAYLEDYIDHDPQAKRLLKQEMRPEIVDGLTTGAKGMFLPVTFQIRYLCQMTTVGQMRDELKLIERRMSEKQILDELYGRAVSKINAQHPDQQRLAVYILRWSVSAKRTMTVRELATALELSIRPTSDETNESYVPDIETILGVCASLITIDESSGQVQMHSTVFEYLVRTMPQLVETSDCAIICAKYLTFRPFSGGASASQKAFNERRSKYFFFDYAARYLEVHVSEHPEQNEELTQVILGLIEKPGNVHAYLQGALAEESDTKGFDWYPRHSTSLHAACQIGYVEAVSMLLTLDSTSIPSLNVKGQTALHIASMNGYDQICVILLQHKASSTIRDGYGWTALSWAITNSYAKVVEVLLEHSRELQELLRLTNNLGDTPLHLAAREGNLSIVHLLIKKGAQLNLRNNNKETPQDIAKKEHNMPMMNVLISAADAEQTKQPRATSLYGPIFNRFQNLADLIGAQYSRGGKSANNQVQSPPQISENKAGLEDRETKIEAISRENSWPKVSEENTSEKIKEIKEFFFPAHMFDRVIELSDRQCILAEDPTSKRLAVEGEASTTEKIGEPPLDEKVWICQLDTDTNLRCLLKAFPRGQYRVMWRFSYNVSRPYELFSQRGFLTYNCSVGKACDPAMFISRISSPNQPFISTDLRNIINPRCTKPLLLPTLDVSETEQPESIILTAQMSGNVDLVDENFLEVDWDDGLAFLIKRISNRQMQGSLIFRGVFLFKQSSEESKSEPKPLPRNLLEVR